MATASVRVGRKADQQQVDQAKVRPGRKPSNGEVEGQGVTAEWVVCPVCFTINEVILDTDTGGGWPRCWNCSCCFEA